MINKADMTEFLSLRDQYIENKFSKLNETQREAVFCNSSHLLILAGAGTGKTTTIINKINYLLKYGEAYRNSKTTREITEVDLFNLRQAMFNNGTVSKELEEVLGYNVPNPYRILAITFTNKAANEMKDRIARVVGVEASKQIQASTFHSLCAKLLRVEAAHTQYSKNFLIYDTEDVKKLIKDIIKEEYGGSTDVNIDIKTVKAYIDGRKSNREAFRVKRTADGTIIKPDYDDCMGDDITKVYEYIGYIYNQRLKKLDAMDFEDLLVNMVELLEGNPDILKKYSQRYKYIFVDEYQDTNKIQEQLISLLESYWHNLCVVGDDDQSIYAFRGASIDNILTFNKRYDNTEVIKLTQNYRSTSNILNLANSIIANNKDRLGKDLWTESGEGDYINLNEYYDDRDEAKGVVNEIKSEHLSLKDTAILYRFNYQSSALEKELVKMNVPYRIVGGTKFYDRKEIKDIIAYLSLIVNSRDDVRLERIINVPARKIGKTTISKLKSIAKMKDRSMLQVCEDAEYYKELSSASRKLKDFYNLISLLRNAMYGDDSPSNMIKEVLDLTGYLNIYKGTVDEDTRKQNIDQLIKNAMDFEADAKDSGESGSLEAFLENISLLSDIDNAEFKRNAVTLMTMHSSKGLEYDNVFLVGWDATKFPSPKEPKDEEERRLAYVGITRARKRLYISHCENSYVYGSVEYSGLSKFVYELDTNLCTGNLIEETGSSTAGDIYTETEQGRNTGANGLDGLNIGNISKHEIIDTPEHTSGNHTRNDFIAGLLDGITEENGIRPGDNLYVETIGELTVDRIEKKGEITLVFYTSRTGSGCFIQEFCNIQHR